MDKVGMEQAKSSLIAARRRVRRQLIILLSDEFSDINSEMQQLSQNDSAGTQGPQDSHLDRLRQRGE